MLKCIIIDDEPLAVKLLSDYVAKSEGLTLAASFTNPIEALQQLDQYTIDLIFLDVQMPELTGVQFAKIIKGKYPVVLTTAYEEYALEGYQLDVIDYLLKPISLSRFEEAIKRVQQRKLPASSLPTSNLVAEEVDYIFIKSGYRTQRVSLHDILYVEGLSDYIRIHTIETSILTLDTLKNFTTILPDNHFLRVHKSYIIALDKVDFIENNRIVIGEKRIPVGGTYQNHFWETINKKQ